MCTLSWWIDARQRGVLFNRDEKRTRSKGLPPRLIEATADAPALLMPVDPDAGGSWIGVNQHGLIVALLNNYPFYQDAIDGQRSRGLLVMDLLERSSTATECIEHLEAMDHRVYRGFLLFCLGHSGQPIAREWAGEQLQPLPLMEDGGHHVLTTSSVRRDDCERYRWKLFDTLPRTADTLRTGHTHFKADDTALGPLMVRDDAATDSLTEITLSDDSATMSYQAIHNHPPVLESPTRLTLDLFA